MDLAKIKNIIFDLGGVIINIDFDVTFQAIADMCQCSAQEVIVKFEALNIIPAYETGQISDAEFRNLVRKEFYENLTDQQIDKAWNALLMDIPKERLELLKVLRKNYRTFLLSNTNAVHIQGVNEILYNTSGEKDFYQMFDKVYYSYEIGMRKPDPEIYDFVLEQEGLDCSETLFLDDNIDNVNSALKKGIHSVVVKAPRDILEILKNAKKA
ncbi:HAD family phosphatase [Cytophagaceae bacterium ABcell3]|nr:HAD family phosphatase [Cytophagaceae bacterium ABcell3]